MRLHLKRYKNEGAVRKMFNPSVSVSAFMTLIDFTLSNARRFYSSMGKPSDTEGLIGSRLGCVRRVMPSPGDSWLKIVQCGHFFKIVEWIMQESCGTEIISNHIDRSPNQS